VLLDNTMKSSHLQQSNEGTYNSERKKGVRLVAHGDITQSRWLAREIGLHGYIT